VRNVNRLYLTTELNVLVFAEYLVLKPLAIPIIRKLTAIINTKAIKNLKKVESNMTFSDNIILWEHLFFIIQNTLTTITNPP